MLKDIKITINGEALDYQELVDEIGEDSFTLESLSIGDILEMIKDKLQDMTDDASQIDIRQFS
jgi:hypothetical protein